MATRKLVRPLLWLESFVWTVKAGSLERAAEHLGVARSVVSEHLRALELSVCAGEPLLERGPGRRFSLTSQGEQLYESTHLLLEQLSLNHLRQVTSAGARLRLGLNPTLSSLLFAGMAKDARQAGTKLEVSLGNPFELVHQVQSRLMDLAVLFTPLPPHPGVEAQTLLHLSSVVFAGPRCEVVHRGRGRSVLRVADLQGLPFVDWLREDPYGGANRARFEANGIGVSEVARVDSFLPLFELLRLHSACAVGPDLSMLRPFPRDIRTWKLVEDPPQEVEVVAIWPTGTLRTEARTFLQSLKDRFERNVAQVTRL